jgi:hypothetical protein
MRGMIRKVLGLGLLSVLLAVPVLLAQRPVGRGGSGGGRSGGRRGGSKGGKKAPTKGGRGSR